MDFTRRLTLPTPVTVRALGSTNDERLAYIDIVGGASAGFETEMDHRLLGHPYLLDSIPFLDGYLARNGIAWPTVPRVPAQEERSSRALDVLQEAAKEWRPPAEGYRTPTDLERAIADFSSRVDMAPLLRAVADLEPTLAPHDVRDRLEEQQQAAEEEWRLLLQIYSNLEAEMDWAGGGVIHFNIPRADLVARDFSRVWVDLDFV